MEMKTYKEWLEEFRTKIKEGAPPPEPYVYSTQRVTPKEVGFIVDLKNWVDEKEYTIMDPFLVDLGRGIAIREGYVIIRSMDEKAGYSMKTKTKGKLTKMDIIEAEKWIKKQGWYADTLLIHPDQEAEFLIRNEILIPSLIPTSYIPKEKRGRNFSGLLNGLNVYCTPLVEGLAFVYKKSQIIVAKTRLKIDFDDLTNPSKLIIQRSCSSAPIDERGVVKITL